MQPVETWRGLLTNDFEKSVFAIHPEIGAIKDRLYDMGAVYAAMSGSGSSLFGLFRSPVDLDSHRSPFTTQTQITVLSSRIFFIGYRPYGVSLATSRHSSVPLP